MVSSELLTANIIIGLLSSFSPCLFPLLPSYLATQVKMKQSKMTSLLSSLALILGIVVVFFSIGFIANKFEQALIQNYFIFARIQAVILIIAGLILIKTPSFMYKIRLPSKLENFIYSENAQKNSILFSFILGLVYTIIAAPCAGALFLGVWSQLIGQTIIDQFLLVLFFALGAGLPFLAMSLFIEDITPKTIGRIHSTSSKISIILGIIFIMVGILLIFDSTKSF